MSYDQSQQEDVEIFVESPNWIFVVEPLNEKKGKLINDEQIKDVTVSYHPGPG